MYDFVIIGAGIVGSFIARELSRYKLNICVLEKEADCSMGASGANSGIIHAGYDAKTGSLKAKFNVSGNTLIKQAAAELGVHCPETGSLVLAFNDEDIKVLEQLMERGKANGVTGLRILSADKVLEKEPNVSREIKGALFAPTAAVISPFELTCAVMENAVSNGVRFDRECEVTDIAKDEYFILSTSKGIFKAQYVINAAGVFTDRIARMIGDDSLKIIPRKGEYMLLDKNEGNIVKTVIFQPPSEMGKGILVTPTTDGNLLIGPTAEDIENKDDSSTSSSGLEKVVQAALKSVPSINVKQVITSFAGIRAVPAGDDFIIGESEAVNGFINVAGIESPGLTSAPAIARHVVEICKSMGIRLEKNPHFNPERKPVRRFITLDTAEQKRLIKENPMYGNIVCRCEKVTEAEIVECIRRPAGAVTVDGVKKRVRAGMGRCQGGFCLPRVMEILSRELNIDKSEVTKRGAGSGILAGTRKKVKVDG